MPYISSGKVCLLFRFATGIWHRCSAPSSSSFWCKCNADLQVWRGRGANGNAIEGFLCGARHKSQMLSELKTKTAWVLNWSHWSLWIDAPCVSCIDLRASWKCVQPLNIEYSRCLWRRALLLLFTVVVGPCCAVVCNEEIRSQPHLAGTDYFKSRRIQ